MTSRRFKDYLYKLYSTKYLLPVKDEDQTSWDVAKYINTYGPEGSDVKSFSKTQ